MVYLDRIKELEERERTQQKMRASQKSQEDIIEKLGSHVTTLRNKLEDQLSTLQEQDDALDEKQQEILNYSVIVNCHELLPDTQGEDCKDIAVNLIKDKLKYDISKECIKAAHRFGKKVSGGTRPILLTFYDLTIKTNLVIKAAKKKTNIYINECLTKKRQDLLYRLRTMRKVKPDLISQCFVKDGKIITKTSCTGEEYVITCEQDLQKFFSDIGCCSEVPTHQ